MTDLKKARRRLALADVMARWRERERRESRERKADLRQRLAEAEADYAEALDRYLWCLDHGSAEDRATAASVAFGHGERVGRLERQLRETT